MTTLTQLDPEEQQILAQDDPELLSEMERGERAKADLKYPKPESGDIQDLYVSMQAEWAPFHDLVNRNQEVRYQRDETPAKWQRNLERDGRIRSRLTHNEILRVVSNQTRNPYRVDVPPAGTDADSVARAKKQTRWCNALLPAFERRAGKPLRRPFVDAQNADGIVAWEFALTDAYDRLDLEYREIAEEKDGQVITRKERDSEYVKRTEKEIMSAGLPFSLRMIEARALYWREDDDGVCKAIVAEQKPYEQVFSKLVDRLSADRIRELELPKPGNRGWPISATTDSFANDAQGTVECLRYYDRRWYVYMVGGIVVDGPREHGLPGVPIFPCRGIVTSSPNLTEQMQGITWGMADIELALNDMLTLGVDVSYTYSRPHPAVETALGGEIVTDPATKKPIKLDLSDPRKIPQLNPGQKVVDAFQNFEPRLNETVLSTLLNIWQRNGMNPVAQGVSPGADPAGYTVNTMIGASLSHYEICLDNEARTWEQVCDFARKVVRDTIEERVFLSAPMEDKREGGVEWLGMGPDDVDETPCVVTIDPMSDQNRLAERQSLEGAWAKGIIPRSIVQQRGYGAEDTLVWDDMIIREKVIDKTLLMLIDTAMLRVRMMQPQPAPPDVPPPGMEVPGDKQLPPGAVPADPNAPTVGKERSEASQGAGSGAVSRAFAGHDRGYRPPRGAGAPTSE